MLSGYLLYFARAAAFCVASFSHSLDAYRDAGR